MLSRAHLLIERDFEQLKKTKPRGISAEQLTEENIFEWTATIEGLPGTAWEGGVLHLHLKFTEHYNSVPPAICFRTIPYHPNVDAETGKLCLSSLQNNPSPDTTVNVMEILQSVQHMLSSPDLVNAVHQEACDMLRETPVSYQQVVMQCVATSQRLKDDTLVQQNNIQLHLRPQSSETRVVAKSPDKPSKPRVGHVLFEDYYWTWSGIATSKSDIEHENPFLESLKEHSMLERVHYGAHADEIQAQRRRQEEEHKELVYGRIKQSKEKDEEEKQEKLNYINRMRRTYLMAQTPRQNTDSPRLSEGAGRERRTAHSEEWEEEVDDLVNWSKSLDDQTI